MNGREEMFKGGDGNQKSKYNVVKDLGCSIGSGFLNRNTGKRIQEDSFQLNDPKIRIRFLDRKSRTMKKTKLDFTIFRLKLGLLAK